MWDCSQDVSESSLDGAASGFWDRENANGDDVTGVGKLPRRCVYEILGFCGRVQVPEVCP
jgi:hypothetical protein